MTDLTKTIEELKALEIEATPGPWTMRAGKKYEGIVYVPFKPDPDDDWLMYIDSIRANHAEDAALIVAMRNALPELLRELEQLAKRVETAFREARKQARIDEEVLRNSFKEKIRTLEIVKLFPCPIPDGDCPPHKVCAACVSDILRNLKARAEQAEAQLALKKSNEALSLSRIAWMDMYHKTGKRWKMARTKRNRR